MFELAVSCSLLGLSRFFFFFVLVFFVYTPLIGPLTYHSFSACSFLSSLHAFFVSLPSSPSLVSCNKHPYQFHVKRSSWLHDDCRYLPKGGSVTIGQLLLLTVDSNLTRQLSDMLLRIMGDFLGVVSTAGFCPGPCVN